MSESLQILCGKSVSINLIAFHFLQFIFIALRKKSVTEGIELSLKCSLLKNPCSK